MPSTPHDVLFQVIRSMRPLQWSKNLLLFAGILFSRNYDKPVLLLQVVWGFGLFCVVSGAMYILNDLVDVEADRLHPRKSRRPLAAGALSPRAALAASLVLAVGGLAGSFWLSRAFGETALAYFIITILYSHIFKHVAIVDIILLALGFVLRAIAGVVVIRIEAGPPVPLTPWFVICVLFAALFIAICKRRHELTSMESAADHRRVLEEYTPAFLDQMIAVSTTATVMSYALYLIAAPGAQAIEPQNLRMISTFPFVIYGVFRYLYLVYRCSEGGEPETLLLKDKPLLLNVVLWLAIFIYLQRG
jgi:4-hydroxybenzoate polyprenyltransferase